MTTNLSTEPQKFNKNGALWTGIVLIALGLFAVIAPRVSTLVSETWIALIVLSAGFTKLVNAVQTRNQDGFLWKILLSVLYIGTGIMLFVSPLTSILTITVLIGSFFITEGVFELILAFRLRGQRNWLSVLGNGIVTLLLGAYVWFQYPFDAPWLLGTLVGASIVVTGISRVMLALNPQATAQNPNEAASA